MPWRMSDNTLRCASRRTPTPNTAVCVHKEASHGLPERERSQHLESTCKAHRYASDTTREGRDRWIEGARRDTRPPNLATHAEDVAVPKLLGSLARWCS
ncbi:hypothetical protein MPTK1_4g10010 [Marchantia polymorpha subsp. ruderalis]|uniref:Uncharacterized protein n=2 Tax=Marchantia polymorpha TaxID=3197 RepID=A0AAF6B8A8_MARPO|nr:hypothetical protein MARPO_0132s0044 [Marchantia polymorpha]BBN08242.1 hypothetical protein Mp_4g10010 [Marchantia polymorpha subsp. ruderalis]|eukprot:PTQ29972.1 hypothetical protein MARPO_0132s0044 [Marchantia polymorpha]